MKRLAWSIPLVLLLAACGSSAKVATAPTTTTSVHTTGTPGLRGTPVPAFACPPRTDTTGKRPAPHPITGVQSLLLCPLGTPGHTAGTVTLAAGGPGFDALVSALSQPDAPIPPGGTACPAYADLTQYVLARTSAGAFLVEIPVDSCGHYLPAPLHALTVAREG